MAELCFRALFFFLIIYFVQKVNFQNSVCRAIAFSTLTLILRFVFELILEKIAKFRDEK